MLEVEPYLSSFAGEPEGGAIKSRKSSLCEAFEINVLLSCPKEAKAFIADPAKTRLLFLQDQTKGGAYG